MKVRFTFFILYFCTTLIYASNLKFYDVNSIHGISMREVASICEDNNGFIWASSKSGVLRLTENSLHFYSLPYETPNIIHTKLLYENDSLIAYTNNGQIFLYNEIFDRFEILIDLRKPLNDTHLFLNRVIIDKRGSILLAVSSGLYKYQNNTVIHIGRDNYKDLHDFIWIDDEDILLATNNGLWLMNTLTLTDRQIYSYNEDNEFKVSELHYEYSDKTLWIGTNSDGLYLFNTVDQTISEPPLQNFSKQPILAIESITDSTVLIGIDGQGVWEVTKEGKHIINIYNENPDNPFSIKGNGVYDIFIDKNKRVWVCTYSGGLSYADQQNTGFTQITHQINNPNSLSNNNTNEILEDSKGNIWFATNDGLSRWNNNTNTWDIFYKNSNKTQVFLSLCEDKNGNIWAGTFSSGVYVLDSKSGKEIAHYSSIDGYSSMTNDYIFDIFKDSQDNLWLGSPLGATFCYLQEEKRFKTFGSHPVYKFTELSKDKLLLACTYGLVELEVSSERIQTLLNEYLINDIIIDNEIVWLATSGQGLLRYNLKNKTIEKYTTNEGLMSNYINSILKVNSFLWLGTETGLCKFDIQKNIVDFNFSPPLLINVSFNQNASKALQNGNLIWGTSNGALLFEPESMHFSSPKGRIFIQDIIISGQSVRRNPDFSLKSPLDDLKEINLKYDQNTITLEIIPIDTRSQVSKFAWKMDGIDDKWTLPSNSKSITYGGIPSGKYMLNIRMYDNSLKNIIQERTLAIKITPPWWKALWFRFIFSILIITIFILVLRYYIDRMRQQHAEDKIHFFTNVAHDIRTSLTLINAPIEELKKEINLSPSGEYNLQIATEQTERLSSVADQLLDFQEADIRKSEVFLVMSDLLRIIKRRIKVIESFAAKQDVRLRLKSNCESYITAIDELKIEKIVDNLISNAIKYSPAGGNVDITINCYASHWTLEVKDQGIGISQKAQKKLFKEFYRGDNPINSTIVGSGIGLLLVKNYVEMHNGNITFESSENNGSAFRINIPYIKVRTDSPTLSQSQVKEKDVTEDKKEVTQVYQSSNISDNTTGKIKNNLLIVEDNDTLNAFLKQSLQEKYYVQIAKDGEEAWELIKKKMPDIIISDVVMPKMDGFELCKLIKSSFETSHIPIILLTALNEKSKQLEGLGLGADDYLTKPFDLVLLEQRMYNIIQNRKVIREKAFRIIDNTTESSIYLNELDNQFVQKAINVVNTNLSNCEFDKETFASEMNVSPSLLYKKLKSLTDLSPTEFIKNIRLNHALQLIKTGRYSITEVSDKCGFSSIKYFSISFKNHFGTPPSKI